VFPFCYREDVVKFEKVKKERRVFEGKDALGHFSTPVKLSCASQKDEVLAQSCG